MNIEKYTRLKTREVKIGDLLLGNGHPIRLQTMTTTDTMDTIATVEQSIRCIEAGAELVRITAPSKKEAENLLNIKNELRRRGYTTPLVADIHFTPNAAEIAARIVEKVRVNPGNYVDKKKFEQIEYTDAEYAEEIDRIRERFTPLVSICKEYGTAMRIGTNHGSLSDRIMSRYGDTPMGMVESAMEFLRIARTESYHNIVLSMKASNPQVMVQAYRLLVQTMEREFGKCYPLHLGVTEAGDGEDGRIKSAVGIGTLLEEGVGDTIRVSLTEDPEFEIPVCKDLVKRYSFQPQSLSPQMSPSAESSIERLCGDGRDSAVNKPSAETNSRHREKPPIVVADLSDLPSITPQTLEAIGYKYDEALDKWNISDMAADYIFTGDKKPGFELPGTLQVLTKDNGAFDIIESSASHPLAELRQKAIEQEKQHPQKPYILKSHYSDLTEQEFQLYSSTDLGALLLDGFGDGIWVKQNNCVSPEACNRILFGILQATRRRISKTEYISCPSCGRTLFDLQETTAKIRAVTNHLKGVKIAIMGCIVNGPGEMADADFGYVGGAPGKINLYVGKQCVQYNLPQAEA
ncbi:MAG TPA: (E)-4-hydroxy-3-methylbut-2-enyl-diphosphate synthase, partial [Chitinophagaceae bacterium]|nr:(E)-4-hydroxy-3-methylbut-2-enyl-diphosphate synthase [Chitinophagaceae bacterium]